MPSKRMRQYAYRAGHRLQSNPSNDIKSIKIILNYCAGGMKHWIGTLVLPGCGQRPCSTSNKYVLQSDFYKQNHPIPIRQSLRRLKRMNFLDLPSN